MGMVAACGKRRRGNACAHRTLPSPANRYVPKKVLLEWTTLRSLPRDIPRLYALLKMLSDVCLCSHLRFSMSNIDNINRNAVAICSIAEDPTLGLGSGKAAVEARHVGDLVTAFAVAIDRLRWRGRST